MTDNKLQIMKPKDDPITLSPKVLAAVKDLVSHTVPLVSLRAWWEVVNELGQTDFVGENDDYAKVFWNDLHFLGNILFALHEDTIDQLKESARDRRKRESRKKGSK